VTEEKHDYIAWLVGTVRKPPLAASCMWSRKACIVEKNSASWRACCGARSATRVPRQARLLVRRKQIICGAKRTRGGVTIPVHRSIRRCVKEAVPAPSWAVRSFEGHLQVDDLLTMKCEHLVGPPRENVITHHNAEAVKARIVAEAANGPPRRTPTKIRPPWHHRFCMDILANAGGVTVSYFEWVQNRTAVLGFGRVNIGLQKIMGRGFTKWWKP